jgi:hypothetical protein
VRIGGVVGLLAKDSLEETVGDSSLAGAAMLAAPEAADLGGLDGIAWHGEAEKMWAGENYGRECRGESEDFSAPFEDLFIHSVQLQVHGRYELTGVREAGDESTL